MNTILTTDKLTKKYDNTIALDNVSITLEAGKIYGLIGRNGAGKSTLMRMLTGLGFPTSGTFSLFGKTSDKEIQKERKRIGNMIETPALQLRLTATENLRMHRILRGIPNVEEENRVLEIVGLKPTNKKVKDFSLGMKQRLGLAITLLNRPEFLILDEPINGLDPIGVVDIRNVLHALCKEQQTTILISSHNLPELYQVASEFIIIDNGQIKKTISINELQELCKHHLLIETPETERVATILEMELQTTNYKVLPKQAIKVYDYLEDKEKVMQAIMKQNVMVTNFSMEGDTLEEYFISIVGGEKNA